MKLYMSMTKTLMRISQQSNLVYDIPPATTYTWNACLNTAGFLHMKACPSLEI